MGRNGHRNLSASVVNRKVVLIMRCNIAGLLLYFYPECTNPFAARRLFDLSVFTTLNGHKMPKYGTI